MKMEELRKVQKDLNVVGPLLSRRIADGDRGRHVLTALSIGHAPCELTVGREVQTVWSVNERLGEPALS